MSEMIVKIDESALKKLIKNHLEEITGVVNVDVTDIKIEVKSKQNYRSEWETSAFRAEYSTRV